MAKDKDKGKETKDVIKIQDDVVKAKEAKAKDVLAFQLSKEGDRVRFLVQQSLGPTLIAEHPVIRRKGAPQSIPPLLLSSPVPSMLARLLLEQDCGSTILPLLLSHRRYHPCLLNCC